MKSENLGCGCGFVGPRCGDGSTGTRSPLAGGGAIVGILFVLAALLVGGFAMLGRRLLSWDSNSI